MDSQYKEARCSAERLPHRDGGRSAERGDFSGRRLESPDLDGQSDGVGAPVCRICGAQNSRVSGTGGESPSGVVCIGTGRCRAKSVRSGSVLSPGISGWMQCGVCAAAWQEPDAGARVGARQRADACLRHWCNSCFCGGESTEARASGHECGDAGRHATGFRAGRSLLVGKPSKRNFFRKIGNRGLQFKKSCAMMHESVEGDSTRWDLTGS